MFKCLNVVLSIGFSLLSVIPFSLFYHLLKDLARKNTKLGFIIGEFK